MVVQGEGSKSISADTVSQEGEMQQAVVWANQQLGIAMDYHNRAATILQEYVHAGRPENWADFEIEKIEKYAQLSLYYSFNPRLATGTLYNLARAQAIQNKKKEVAITLGMFRENLMPEHFREAIFREPDFRNIEGLQEFEELKKLYIQIREHGLNFLYNRVKYGVLQDNKIVTEISLQSKGNAEEVFFRFENPTKQRLDNLIFEFKFLRPLGLSGTDKALTLVHHTEHGRGPDNAYYLIRHVLSLGPEDCITTRTELNVTDPHTNKFSIDISFISPNGESLGHQVISVYCLS